MKKFLIILAVLIAISAASFFGMTYYMTHPSDEYTTENFSFSVPGGFGLDTMKDGNTYVFRCLGEKIYVEDITYNCTPETAEAFLYYYDGDENIKVEPFTGSQYTGFFRSSDNNSEGKKETGLSYILGTDTHYFNVSCICGSLKSKLLKKSMDKIAESAVYTSDFRIADRPETYDFKWATVNTGKKYTCKDKTEEEKKEKPIIKFVMNEVYAEADTYVKTYSPTISLTVVEADASPADLADDSYNKRIENKDKYNSIKREQVNMFGYDCERLFYETKPSSDDDTIIHFYDLYFFRNGKYLYNVTANYRNSSEEADAREMLGNITIKDIDK